jgi:hypothetical protein
LPSLAGSADIPPKLIWGVAPRERRSFPRELRRSFDLYFLARDIKKEGIDSRDGRVHGVEKTT